MEDDKYYELDKRMALLEQKLDVLANNHLAHIQDDITWLKRAMWGAAVGLIINLTAVVINLVS